MVRQRPAKPLFPGSNPGGASRDNKAAGFIPAAFLCRRGNRGGGIGKKANAFFNFRHSRHHALGVMSRNPDVSVIKLFNRDEGDGGEGHRLKNKFLEVLIYPVLPLPVTPKAQFAWLLSPVSPSSLLNPPLCFGIGRSVLSASLCFIVFNQ